MCLRITWLQVFRRANPCRMSRPFPFLIPMLMFAATPARAQTQDIQAWEQVNVIVPVAAKVRVTAEEIARISDRQGGLYTTEFGALLGYQVANRFDLGFGYRRVGTFNGNTGADEERVRQQMVLTHGLLAGRLRLERCGYTIAASDAHQTTVFRTAARSKYSRELPALLILVYNYLCNMDMVVQLTAWGSGIW